MNGPLNLIYPNWQAPKGVFAYSTTRLGGVSLPPYDSLNMGAHVGDVTESVVANRALLPGAESVVWLEQVHGTDIVEANVSGIRADASFSRSPGVTCAVMTADCLPLVLCDDSATVVAACHAGWRGLADGVVENTVAAMGVEASSLNVWIGPAISQKNFEVERHVVDAFSVFTDCYRPSATPGRFLLDLPQIANSKLQALGVKKVSLSGYCTYARPDLFYSHRLTSHQGGVQTGRIVTGICLTREF